LRFLREYPGAFCLIKFAGKAVSIEAGFLHQGERVGDKAKLVLRYRQAASIPFHGVSGKVQVGGKIAAIFAARVLVAGRRNRAARMLPNLSPVVPMETVLGQSRGDLVRLFAVKLNPNPPANDFGQFPKFRCFPANQIQQGLRRQSPVLMPAGEINSLQFVPTALCGPVLEL